MRRPPTEPGREPGVYGARRHFTPLGAEPDVALAEHPLELGGREVGIEHQAGALAHHRFQTLPLELGAPVGGPAILPDDRRPHRLAGCPFPEHHGFALIGDPDRGGALPGARQDLTQIVRIVLDPAGLGKVLRELLLGGRQHGSVLVEEDRAGAGGALVEGEDRWHRANLAKRKPPARPGATRFAWRPREGIIFEPDRSTASPRILFPPCHDIFEPAVRCP